MSRRLPSLSLLKATRAPKRTGTLRSARSRRAGEPTRRRPVVRAIIVVLTLTAGGLVAAGLTTIALPATAQAPPREATPPDPGPATSPPPSLLSWQLEAPERDVDWRRAAKRCKDSEAGGHTDWRLPTADELSELAARATGGDAEARATIAALGSTAAWSHDVSPSSLAWAASFEHGYLFRLHISNRRDLRALCVRGTSPEEDDGDESTAAADAVDADPSWLRPLDSDTDSALLWPCEGTSERPVVIRGSLEAFRRGLPPGQLHDRVAVDFIVGADGVTRFVGPAPGTPERTGRLAVLTVDSFRFRPATCDGKPIAVFYHLDFGG